MLGRPGEVASFLYYCQLQALSAFTLSGKAFEVICTNCAQLLQLLPQQHSQAHDAV